MSTSPSQPGSGPTDEDCEHTLERVWEFLDHELDDASAEAIRVHLAACEPCLDAFDLEQAVKSLIHRSCGGDRAPAQLRARVMFSLTTVRQQLR